MSAIAISVMAGATSKVMAQEGFSLNLKATPLFSFLQNSNDNNNSAVKKKATINANFGLGTSYNFSDNAGVGLDVLYALQGQKTEVAGLESNQKLEYLKIPVYFSYNTGASKVVSFYGKIGPQVSFLTNAKINVGKNDDFIKNKDKFEDVVFGGMAIAGVQFKLSQDIYLQTGLYFDYDFTNAEDKDYPGFTAGRVNTYNMNAGLQVELKYSF